MQTTAHPMISNDVEIQPPSFKSVKRGSNTFIRIPVAFIKIPIVVKGDTFLFIIFPFEDYNCSKLPEIFASARGCNN